MSDYIQNIIRDFSPQKLASFIRQRATLFKPANDTLDAFLEKEAFDRAEQIGLIEFPNSQSLIVAAIHVADTVTARSSKRKQYELAKRILKAGNHNAGIFAFYDDGGRFRLSLVTITYHGTKRQFSSFRRYTFFVDPHLPNKTFVQQLSKANFATLDGILETFSLEAVSDEFYKEFKPRFDALADSVVGLDLSRPQAKRDQPQPAQLQQDFALLFVIRILFLGFVQKKGWLGGNPRFLQDFWREYAEGNSPDNTFYKEWLEPLFFEALSSPPGRKVAYGKAPFSEAAQQALEMAPYLNGELFKRKQGVDDQGLWIPDELIGEFFDFLFQYNFTVEENELYDEELELNPEFLGIIFERLTNMDQGAVYTPRVEVDLMCRLALVKWLEQATDIARDDLYHLFFREAGTGEAYDEYQKQGDFSPAEIRTLIERLQNITICDPAAGSGAFEVGMLQVLDQTLENLYNRNNTPADLRAKAPTPFERKKAIIANSLYGVEVKRWAVWINHLRLWLTLFVDMPDAFKISFEPLLPNLTFKVRTGDSLVQRIGDKTFPIHGHANLPAAVKRKITQLKKKKRDFFYNESHDYRPIEQEEMAVFRGILDAEIEARKEQIRRLIRPKPRQTGMFQAGPEQTELDFTEATKAQQEALEAEIAELEAQKRSLKDERPFIWSIEFAEIFFDRGGFDVVIGNPPYVRKEDIADASGALAPKIYKDALLEMVRLDFPDYFAKSRAQTDQFKRGRKPSGHSDLYTYFYVRSLRLLNPRGIHVFICSNAWLDVGYGAWLQEFFLRRVPLQLVIDNHARRSFARSDINTIITVAGSGVKSISPKHTVYFVAFKQPFEEAVLSDNLLAIECGRETLKTESFRSVPISVNDLLLEGSEATKMGPGKYAGGKWGCKYLRAPDFFIELLKDGDLVPLSEIATVLGYVHDNNIGDNYPKTRFVRSLKDLHHIKLEEKDTRLFGVTTYGNSRDIGNFLFARTFGDRYFIVWNTCEAVAKEFYRIQIDGKLDEWLALLLNSTFLILQYELLGLTNLGGGAIKFSTSEIKKVLLPEEFVQIRSIKPANREKFLHRDVASIFAECGIDPESEIPIAEQEPNPLPDRKALDDIVFDALGLSAEERKEVYRAVCQLVWERIGKAKSV